MGMPDFRIEKEYQGVVAGIDEVGRGPWAGPVIAAA
ncbi:MAG: ribonuclease HII, partial [Pseudomonadota bacterium]|nr:ribonuclease HII [Pseudomonadota bacterium]